MKIKKLQNKHAKSSNRWRHRHLWGQGWDSVASNDDNFPGLNLHGFIKPAEKSDGGCR